MKRKFTLIAALFICFAAFAQVPNGSFETWKTFGFMGLSVDYPDKWYTSNLMVLAGADPSASKVPGRNGGSAVALATISFDDGQGESVIPGYMMSAEFDDLMDEEYADRFKLNAKPIALEGYFKYLPVDGDTFSIGIVVYSNGNMVGEGYMSGFGTTSAFTKFTIDIDYLDTATVDSATISVISSSNSVPHEGTVIVVDDLTLKNSPNTGVQSRNNDFKGRIYPVPASERVWFEMDGTYNGNITVDVRDASGRLIKTVPVEADGNRVAIDISDCPAGFLFGYIHAGEASGQFKIVRQ